jgi:hypothetical protein
MLLVLSVLVEIPNIPKAHAALGGLTNFEIDGNQVVNGPSPPSGGAGIDWANAAQFLQNVAQPTDFCGNGIDPTTVTGKVNEFDWFAPNPFPANINGKTDICQAFTAWEPIDVTTSGVTTVHYVLYGGWSRLPQPGDMSFFVPLIGGPTNFGVTLVEFDFNPGGGAGGSTNVTLQRWNGTAFVPTQPPANAFQAATDSGTPSFGEFAIDLTAAGVLPESQTCSSVVASYVVTRPGNGNADLADYVGVPPVQISNCSSIRITKATNPALPDTPATFTYTLDRPDGAPVQDNSATFAPNFDSNASANVIAGSLTVPTTPTDNFTNIFTGPGYRLLEDLPPPSPWTLQTIVCNYFDPTQLDANLKATPATATLTNADGSWSGQTFTVAPTEMLPADANGVAVNCTISNQAPSLKLAKHVVNTVLNAPATPDMWTLSATPTTGPAVDFGPGTSDGVSRIVAPSTYTLAEAPNTSPAPPAGYAASTWSCVDAANNPVTVTGGDQITVASTDNISCTITNTAQDLARLTLVKVVPPPGADPASAFTLTAEKSASSPGTIDGTAITGATGTAAVTDRHVQRGVFALSETGPAGYLQSWQCTDGTGATVSTVNQVTIPAVFTDPAQLNITCTATNTTTALDVNISGPAVNPAGRSHTFTLRATRVDTGAPLSGAQLDLSFSGPGTVTANTCVAPAGTNAAGLCTVMVTSDTPGLFTITANGFTNQGPDGPNPGQPFAFPVGSGPSSTKLWTTYRVEGDSAINLVSQSQHTFTLRGFQNDGTAEVPLRVGSVISYTWSGTGAVSPAGQCTVDASGGCNVVVNAAGAQPESSTLTVTSITVTLPNGSGGDTSYTLSPGDVALNAPLPAPTKSWIQFRVRVTPASQTNLVGQPHTFTVTAEFSDTPGVWQPVSGGSVGFEWTSAVANVDPANTTCPTLSTSGTCTVTVVQEAPPVPGTGTLSVTGLFNPTVTIGGVTRTFNGTNPLPSSDVDLSAATGEKTWIFIEVTITPGVDNLAGESHDFTVQVRGFDGGPPVAIPNAIVTSSVVSSVGPAAVTGDTCAAPPGTDANGQCTITVNNPASGSIALQLQNVSGTFDGLDFNIDLAPGAVGLRSDAVVPIQTDKVWWQYRVILSSSSTNPLGVSHTFTATVERSNDDGATWQPVPAGTLLQDQWTDPLGVSSVDTANSTCLTTGTAPAPIPPATTPAEGTCTFAVTSTAATTGTLTIQGIASTWLDRNRNGQSGAPTDPVPNPDEFASEIVTIPASQFNPTSVLSATKTWWDFAVDVSGPAENPVGTDHTFILTVTFSDGFGFQPVAPGTTMTYTWSGPTGSAEDTTRSTCDPTDGPGTAASGQCIVVIASPTVPGTGTLTITGINSTTIPQPSRQVSFTFPTPATTTKTWIAYQASLSPDSTNLAGTSHDFTVTVQQDRGSGFGPVPDETTIAVTLSDPTKLAGSTCSTPGTVGGICTVTVTSAAPGTVTLTPGAIGVALLSGADPPTTVPVTVQPGTPAYATPPSATKTWLAYTVTLSPSATNLDGVPHDFTITATVTDGTTTTPAAGASIAFNWTGAGALLTPSPCTTSAAGTCTVTVDSASAGIGTLTVTSLTDSAGRVVDLTTAGAPGQAPGQVVPLTATKTWVAYTVTISPSASNPVGTQHDFTITATVTDGTTTSPAPNATITFTWTGAGTLVTPSPCTTNAAGTCTVSVTSPAAGTGTLTVTSLTDSAGNVVDLTTAGAPGQTPVQQVPLTASKTWLQYRVLLTANATNLTGVPHTFTATVQQTGVTNPIEADWTAVPNGTTLTASTTGSGTLDPASTCLTGGTSGGTCTFVVHDAGPGALTLNVTAIAATTVNSVPFANIALSAPATATKTWIAVSVSVTPPSATNLAGDPHTFTVHVDVAGADGTSTPLPADGATVTWTFSGPGNATNDTCATGTTAGTCVVTFANSGAGAGTFTATSVTFTVNGTPLTVNLTAAGAGQLPGQTIPPTAAKTWVAYTVTVSPSATNPEGTQHNFTITATVTDGTTTTPAAGASIAFTWSGAGTLVTASPCTTDQNGTCTVSVTSPTAGTGTLTVTSLTDSAGATVDLTAPGMPGQSPVQVVPVESTKTWLQYRVLLSPSATNLTGVPHTFTATVQQTGLANPTAADWTAVPDGTMLNVSSSGTGSVDPASSCLTPGTTSGACQFVVHDAGPGTITLQVNSIGSTVLDGVTFFDIGLSAPATASKTWVGYTVTVSTSATNPVGTQHDFVITAMVNDGTGPVPAANASVAFTWSGAGMLVTPSPCTTSSAGTCTVSVTSPASGSGSLTVTTLTDSGGRVVNLTVAGAPGQATNQVVPLETSKTWLQFRVLLSPDATNLTGVPHTFTATVQQTGLPNPTEADWTAAPDGTTLNATPSGSGTLDPASSCLTTGIVGGTCQFIVRDAGPGTLTLTDSSINTTEINGTQFTDIALTTPSTATKTWIDYTAAISPSATNLVGMSHNFVITATVNDGTGPVPAAGASMAFTWSGAGSPSTASPCITAANGTCTVTVNSSTPGTGTITVTSLTDSTGRVVDLTTEGGPGQASAQVVPLTATKTWIGWTLDITKASSVTGSTQPFSFTTTGFAAPTDQQFQLTIGQTKELPGLPAGTFTINELVDSAHLPAPWRFESLSCTGAHDNATVTTVGPTATVTIGVASPTGPPVGGVVTCTYTNEQMNLVVHKTDNGATPVAGGDPFNYTVTVTNEGSVATTAPVTVTDTLGPGLEFAGTPTIPAAAGSCAPPSGSTLVCTITQSIVVGGTVTIIIPARVLAGTVGPVRNDVTIDSTEDPLCPDGTCPPPPECPEPATRAGPTAAVLAETVTAADPPSDNQDCVLTAVTAAGGGQIVPPPTTAPPPTVTGPPLARTGPNSLPAALGGVFFLTGVGLMVLERRRRTRLQS